MATQTLHATTHLSGSLDGATNALGAPDGVFTTTPVNTSFTARFGFAAPAAACVGDQPIVIRVRKNGGSNAPVFSRIVIYQSGTQVQEVTLGFSSNNTTGEDITTSFDGSLITNAAEAAVEIVCINGGGGPSARSSGQIDAFTWTATTEDAGGGGDPDPGGGGVPPPGGEADATVAPWSTVTLPAGAWTQNAGPTVTVAGSTFTAPPSMSDQTLVFADGAATYTVLVTRSAHGLRTPAKTTTPVRFTPHRP